jgi:small subunit ribosomal protein S16
MEVAIRMKMLGGKGRPFFRIVAISKPLARDGKVLEELGHYDPLKTDNQYSLKKDRLEYWLKNGAKPSATVKDIMKKVNA